MTSIDDVAAAVSSAEALQDGGAHTGRMGQRSDANISSCGGRRAKGSVGTTADADDSTTASAFNDCSREK